MFCFIIYININMQLLYKVKLSVYDIACVVTAFSLHHCSMPLDTPN